MQAIIAAVLMVLAAFAAPASTPTTPPEFTHHRAVEWLNSDPLTLAKLKGKVVMVEFWAFECVNCLNSHEWVESVADKKGPAGLVVVGVHTPELPDEHSESGVRRAVQRLKIHYPVMIDEDGSYWRALHNQFWPTFYLIGRDGLLYGSFKGEMHVGDARAQQAEQVIDQLLAAAPAT